MKSWLSDFICETESPWSIIQKYLYANVLSYNELMRELNVNKPKPSEWNRFKILIDTKFNIESFAQLCGFDIIKHQQLIFTKLKLEQLTEKNLKSLLKTKLRFCPVCIKKGYHSIYHQMSNYDECVYHKCSLLTNCPKCKIELGYINKPNTINAFKCNCGYLLIKNEHLTQTLNSWKKHSIDFAKKEVFEDFYNIRYFLNNHDSFENLNPLLRHQIQLKTTLKTLDDNQIRNDDLKQCYKAILRRLKSLCTCNSINNKCSSCKAIYKLRLEIEQQQPDWINTRFNTFYNGNQNAFFIKHKLLFETIRYVEDIIETFSLNEQTIIKLKVHLMYYFLKNRYEYWLMYVQSKKENLNIEFIWSIQLKNSNCLEVKNYKISSSDV